MAPAWRDSRRWKSTSSRPSRRNACWRRVSWVCLVYGYSLRYPVHRYFTAVRRHEEPHPPGPAETHLAVTRRQFVVRHYELSPPAFRLLEALLAGRSVGEAIARTVETSDEDLDLLAANLRIWFQDWAAEGFFRVVEIPD